MSYKPKRNLKDYPMLDIKPYTEPGPDGKDVRRVRIIWGKPGEEGHHITNLTEHEGWADKSKQEQRDEAYRRYDDFLDVLELAKRPQPVSIPNLMQQLDDIDDQIRALKRQRLDVEEQIAMTERGSRTVEE